MSLQLNAAKRLQAATDVKGAIAYLKKTFVEHGLAVKSAKSLGDDNIVIEFKGPCGPVQVAFDLIDDSGTLYVEITDNEGINPQASDNYELQYVDDVTLKGKKKGSKGLNGTLKEYDKAVERTHAYALKLEECERWIQDFQEVLAELERNMDVAKPRPKSKGPKNFKPDRY